MAAEGLLHVGGLGVQGSSCTRAEGESCCSWLGPGGVSAPAFASKVGPRFIDRRTPPSLVPCTDQVPDQLAEESR